MLHVVLISASLIFQNLIYSHVCVFAEEGWINPKRSKPLEILLDLKFSPDFLHIFIYLQYWVYKICITYKTNYGNCHMSYIDRSDVNIYDNFKRWKFKEKHFFLFFPNIVLFMSPCSHPITLQWCVEQTTYLFQSLQKGLWGSFYLYIITIFCCQFYASFSSIDLSTNKANYLRTSLIKPIIYAHP